MSKKMKLYSAEFKAKIVIELLGCDITLNELASKYAVTPKSIQNWKKQFLANAKLAFNADIALSEFKEQLKSKDAKINELHRQLGKRTSELEWAEKKLQSLGYETKSSLIESKQSKLSVAKQCALLGFNRSNVYYVAIEDPYQKSSLLREIDNIYTEIPFYGYRKIYHCLKEKGFSIGMNRVRLYMRELGLKTIYPTKKILTTLAHPAHKKYPYLLRDMNINQANQVWSTDITYIKVKGGFIYLAAIIDWYSKAILAHRISNTIDASLVIDVLNDALEKYGVPEIFNTDQGSQYTSHEHTELLIKNNIKISMDGKGRATDNIAIERFWRSAKYENIYLNEYHTIHEVKQGVKEYVAFYNTKRPHQTLDYQKPMDVYHASINLSPNKAA